MKYATRTLFELISVLNTFKKFCLGKYHDIMERI